MACFIFTTTPIYFWNGRSHKNHKRILHTHNTFTQPPSPPKKTQNGLLFLPLLLLFLALASRSIVPPFFQKKRLGKRNKRIIANKPKKTGFRKKKREIIRLQFIFSIYIYILLEDIHAHPAVPCSSFLGSPTHTHTHLRKTKNKMLLCVDYIPFSHTHTHTYTKKASRDWGGRAGAGGHCFLVVIACILFVLFKILIHFHSKFIPWDTHITMCHTTMSRCRIQMSFHNIPTRFWIDTTQTFMFI